MIINLRLEPAGKVVEGVCSERAEDLGMIVDDQGRLEVSSALCSSILPELCNRCYDLGLSGNAEFNGLADY